MACKSNLRRISVDSYRHTGAWAPCPLPWRQVEVLLLGLLREKFQPNTESLCNLGRSCLIARKVNNKAILNREKTRAP